MIGKEIEIFRAGTRASRGITADNIAEVASHDLGERGLPLCFGHPKSDTPAAGIVGKLRADGNKLFATIRSLTPAAEKGLKDGEWTAPSMAFFDPDHEANPARGKWAPRHLALLGAAAPGIPGLSLKPAFAFDADGDLVTTGEPAEALVFAAEPTSIRYVFTTKETATMDETPEQKAAREANEARTRELDQREQEFAARETRVREAGNSALIDGLVASGKVLPADVPQLRTIFNALDGGEHEFGASDKSDKATPAVRLATFLSTAIGKRVPLDDRSSPSREFSGRGDAPKSGNEFMARAEKLAKDEGITFEAAAERLESGDAA